MVCADHAVDGAVQIQSGLSPALLEGRHVPESGSSEVAIPDVQRKGKRTAQLFAQVRLTAMLGGRHFRLRNALRRRSRNEVMAFTVMVFNNLEARCSLECDHCGVKHGENSFLKLWVCFE